jgi:hypothetical protein
MFGTRGLMNAVLDPKSEQFQEIRTRFSADPASLRNAVLGLAVLRVRRRSTARIRTDAGAGGFRRSRVTSYR